MKRFFYLLILTFVSNFLFAQAECHLQNLSYEIHKEGEEFYFKISEPDAETLASNYNVIINGDFYENDQGFFGPLKADCETNYTLEVNHRELDFCAFKASVGSVCFDPSECKIGEIEFSFPECTPNGVVFVTLDFKHENTSDSFSLKGNGEFYGYYSYSNLPIEVGPFESDCTREVEFVVSDAGNDQCANDVGGIVICCPDFCDQPEFRIVEQECDEESLFMKLEVVDGPAPTNITLQVNEEYVEEFEVEGDYVYLKTPLPLFGVLNTVTLCEVGFADVCCFSQNFFTDSCGSSDVCKIYGLNYRIDECQQGEEVFIALDFQHLNTASDSFFVTAGGIDYGTFFYEDLPVEVGPFESACDVVQILTVSDGADPNCAAEEELYICCGQNCLEPIFEIVNIECNDAVYELKAELINPIFSDALYVAVNGSPVDYQFDFPYLYVRDSLTIAGLVYELTVCTFSNSTDECCYSMLFDLSECGNPGECKIGDLFLGPTECIDADLPGFFLSFEYANVGSKGFSVQGNGIDYGDFRYEDLPIFLPASDSCGIFYEFIVADNEKECRSVVEYGEYCCNGFCSFRAKEIRVRCAEGILREVAFFLEEDTDPLKSYEVFINGIFIGETNDNNVFLEFETEIELDATADRAILTICDDECCVDYSLDVSECGFVPPVECSIDGVTLDDMECGDEGLFFTLDFDHEGTSGDQFDLFSIFGYFGTYSYSDLPVRVKNFPNVNLGLNVLFICDQGSFCCQAHLFNSPLCLGVLDSDDQAEVRKVAKSLSVANYKYIVQNPAVNQVEVRSPVDKNVYTIFDSSGQQVKLVKTEGHRSMLDLSGLTSGLYVVKVENEMGIKIEKLIISK